MNYTKNVILALICLVSQFGIANAGIGNDIPSCYAANKLAVGPPAPERELFVLVDQTTPLDATLKQSIMENVGAVLKPGAAFAIGSFSSFSQGNYVEVLTSGALEMQIDSKARDDISVKLLHGFDACMKGQLQYGAKVVEAGLNKALGGISSDLVKSDVIASLKELSGRVRQSVAKDKVVLIASDMLENSSVTSFYAKQAVRQIDSKKELKLVADNQLFGDFGGAKVYVIGAGLLAEDAKHPKGVYRSTQTMQALSRFWSGYFQKSNAELVEFGQPALLNPIR